MDSLWTSYWAETIGAETTYSADGKAMVCLVWKPDTVHIQHMYVEKDSRGDYSHKFLEDVVLTPARAKGIKLVTACCDQNIRTYRESLKSQINAGFKISAVQGTVVYTYLEV